MYVSSIARIPMVEPDNRGKSTLFDVQFEQNNGNNCFNNNQEAIPNPNPFPQYPVSFNIVQYFIYAYLFLLG